MLVVENEWLIAADLCRVLTDDGAHIVGPVASAYQALTLIEICGVDAAVLDIHLGDGQNVYCIAELLQARGVPFIFATGIEAICIRPDFADIPHLVKPFAPITVGRILAEASDVAGRKLARSARAMWPASMGLSIQG